MGEPKAVWGIALVVVFVIFLALFLTCAIHTSRCDKSETPSSAPSLLSQLPDTFFASFVNGPAPGPSDWRGSPFNASPISFAWDRTVPAMGVNGTQLLQWAFSNLTINFDTTWLPGPRCIVASPSFVPNDSNTTSENSTVCIEDGGFFVLTAMDVLRALQSASRSNPAETTPPCGGQWWRLQFDTVMCLVAAPCCNCVFVCQVGNEIHQVVGVGKVFSLLLWVSPFSNAAAVVRGQACPLLNVSEPSPPELAHHRAVHDGLRRRVRSAVGVSTTCLFVHGVGVYDPTVRWNTYALRDEFPSYWGDAAVHVRCAIKKFLVFDTVMLGWDNEFLHRSLCSAAGALGGAINNTVIIAHSMGNLILAAALKTGVCSWHASSRWYAISPPWRGSNVANWLAFQCGNAPTPQDAWINEVLAVLKYCCQGVPCPAFRALSPQYLENKGLIEVAAPKLNGSLCGYTRDGESGWFMNQGLELIATRSGLGLYNDGVVEYGACVINPELFQATYTSSFYAAMVNHVSATCRYGDPKWVAFFPERKAPCAWLAGLTY